jgi:hypothetical protein
MVSLGGPQMMVRSIWSILEAQLLEESIPEIADWIRTDIVGSSDPWRAMQDNNVWHSLGLAVSVWIYTM